MTKKHMHAELIHAWADGEIIQWFSKQNECWYDIISSAPIWGADEKYRIKPKTININGFEVPEPCREPLPNGQQFYICFYPIGFGYLISRWSGDKDDMRWLKLGLIHSSKEGAALHSNALLSFTRRSTMSQSDQINKSNNPISSINGHLNDNNYLYNRRIAQIRLLIDHYGPVNAISAIKEACELELENERDEKKRARIKIILEHMETIYTEVEKI